MLIISNLTAYPIDEAVARKVGASFAQASFNNVVKADGLNLVKATDTYFVFNVGQNGFVIVSADDCFRPIVGYSDEGSFPTENPSPEMMYYLDNLSLGREYALQAGLRQDEQTAGEWRRLLNGKGLPSRNGSRGAFHLMQTKWNQNYPYNKFCPSEGGRTYAGCVATAMSQVMNYWKHPTHGYGQHSYTYGQYGLLSANFAEATYDFDLMPNGINEQSPVENIDAIALFMYHCGVAVDMMYSTSGSGAYSEDVPDAVLKYFGYTNCIRLVYRDQYPLEEFQALLKDQFDLGWPVYYSGTDADQNSGHAFVCDGYDDNDMFHFNWGWSGSGDGFYAIDALNVSGYGFNSGQAFTANYVPAEVFLNTGKAPTGFTAIPNGDDNFSVTLSWTNPTLTLNGYPIEAIDQIVVMRDGEVVKTFDNPTAGEAMTYVDVAGLPILVNYTVHVVCNGVEGRKAHADGVNLGPTCPWTVNLMSGDESGWGDAALGIVNSSGVLVAELAAERGESQFQVEVPQGRIALTWTAPVDELDLGMEILDAAGQQVFAYEGPSTLMPQGVFFETVNSCGGEPGTEAPSDLTAELVDDDVVLRWTGITDPGYGYNIYRDGYFYTMVADVTSFTDEDGAMQMHSYFVTAFLTEGESDPSNTVCAAAESAFESPQNLDFEVLDGNKIKLSWEAPTSTDELLGYYVYRRASTEEYKRIKTCPANSLNYTDSFRVPDGDRYYYKVSAVYNRDYSESAPARSARHPEWRFIEINRSHIPSGLALEQEEGMLLLQWEAPMLAETYNVYRNGELMVSDVIDSQYSLEADGEPACFQVTGVRNGVESNRSNKAYYANYAVDEADTAQGLLYPVPTHGQVVVKFDGLREVTVFSASGQQLASYLASGNVINIDLSGLKSGVYSVKIATEKAIHVEKVVLVK